MFENEEQLKSRLAKNLTFYRESAGFTQLELAEKLNYSDKSVSKWERGEGIPGVYVLSQIAGLYGVSVNDLLAEAPEKPKRFSTHNNLIITLLSFGLVWLVATLTFIILHIVAPDSHAWRIFLYAVPVNAIVSIVFASIWWNKIVRFFSVSALIWSGFVCLVSSVPVENMNLFYIIAAIMQGLTLLGFMLRKTKKNTKKEKNASVNFQTQEHTNKEK